MLTKWKSFLQANAADWQLPATENWQVLVHNNYHSHYAGLNLFWFAPRDRFPRVVTKLCRQPELLKREFSNLSHAYSCASTLVPRPLHVGADGNYWALWMGGVEGVPLVPRACWKAPVLRSMVAMLGSLHRALGKAASGSDHRHERMVTVPLKTLAEFRSSPAVRELCLTVAEKASAAWLASQPAIPQHGDLFRSNILNSGHQWHVVDWESFGMLDLPGYDLLTLLCSLLLESGPEPEKWNPRLLREVPSLLRIYAEQVGLVLADIPLLLPLTLANWFHLQWRDGRREFINRMYGIIQNYADHMDQWHSNFT